MTPNVANSASVTNAIVLLSCPTHVVGAVWPSVHVAVKNNNRKGIAGITYRSMKPPRTAGTSINADVASPNNVVALINVDSVRGRYSAEMTNSNKTTTRTANT